MPGIKIPAQDVPLYWAWTKPLLQDALDAVKSYQTLDFIKQELVTGANQLWLFEGNGIIVTRMVDMPDGTKACFLLYCAGNDIDEMLESTEDTIIKWAREQGCTVVILGGRRGWGPKLKSKGYKLTSVVLEREI